MADLAPQIASELSLKPAQVSRALALLAEGATVPFLARYRKEATGGLDEVELRKIQDRNETLTELARRRQTILETIEGQGKLTPELRRAIEAATTRTELEDLYLPYRPKRRTRAQKAREAGYEPLADLIWAQADALDEEARRLVASFEADREAAWQGARDIVAERIAEDATLRRTLRELAFESGLLQSARSRARKAKGPTVDPSKYRDYFEFSEPVRSVPPHRVLAISRGERDGVLRVSVAVDRDAALSRVRARVAPNRRAALAGELAQALEDAWDRLLAPAIESDVRKVLGERAETEAIRVFADNLQHILMAAPLGPRRVVAIDPGFRTGCKVVALDATGALLEDTVIYPHQPQQREREARERLAAFARRHRAEAIAIGNGTAGRESLALVKSMQRDGELPRDAVIVSVNESGASIYSASEIAREEFPDRDVTVRGAVSIGRRLQDPLAELVKIDPKSIGVGQYQHDVNQRALQSALDAVVETCVNRVGVELNTASARLLAHVAGLGPALARNIVAYRAENGPFSSRAHLKKVKRLGGRAFEQAAGFLRIRGAADPLDASAVHPERYRLVQKMAADRRVTVADLVGNAELARSIDLSRYVSDGVGEPTLRDIVAELEKPGRDPREKFEQVAFRDDVTEIEHLEEGMVLEGVVTNVTNFGAFVDVGVHQDGLVHVSELAHHFVRDPAEVVKVADRVRVKVIAVDLSRRRIGLSIKQTTGPGPRQAGPDRGGFNTPRFRRR